MGSTRSTPDACVHLGSFSAVQKNPRVPQYWNLYLVPWLPTAGRSLSHLRLSQLFLLLLRSLGVKCREKEENFTKAKSHCKEKSSENLEAGFCGSRARCGAPRSRLLQP